MTNYAANIDGTSKEKLVLAAHDAFLRNGAIPISYGDVSAIAGFSRALVYSYFPNPEDLVNEILRWQTSLLDTKRISEAIQDDDLSVSALKVLRVYFEHLCQYGPLLHIASQSPLAGSTLCSDYTRLRNATLRALTKKAAAKLNLSIRNSMSLIVLLAGLAEEGARLTRKTTAEISLVWRTIEDTGTAMLKGIEPHYTNANQL